MRPLLAFFVLFLFSFSSVSSYAGLPPIMLDPGVPPLPVPAVPAEESSSGGGGGLGNASAGNASVLNGSLPLPVQEPTAASGNGSAIVVADAPAVPAAPAVDSSGPVQVRGASWLLPFLGLALVVAIVAALLVMRRRRQRLPDRLRRF